jgi:hypothetical protein
MEIFLSLSSLRKMKQAHVASQALHGFFLYNDQVGGPYHALDNPGQLGDGRLF